MSKLTLLEISFGFVFFRVVNNFLRFFAPFSVRSADLLHWKWTNVTCSLLHSIISGIGSCLLLYLSPELADDLIKGGNWVAHMLVSFSIGYFIHDALDMIMNNRKKSTYELLVHHLFVISCFGLAVFSGNYLGYAVVALVIEINSVFLHVRQMMTFQGVSKRALCYRLNSLMTIVTFMGFRVSTLGWMTRWLVLHRDDIPLAAYSLGSIALATLTVMNIVLFLRLLHSDFGGSRVTTRRCCRESSGRLTMSVRRLMRGTEEEEVLSDTRRD